MNGVLVAASAILWALSSALWLASAMQKAPYKKPAPNSEGSFSLGDGGIFLDGVQFSASAQHNYHRRQSQLNSWAAGLSAVAAALAAVSLWFSQP